MIKIVITTDDLDEKTIKVKDKKLTVPGAEIEVLDSYDLHDTDTHYVDKSEKFLKHVETGAVWPASIAVMKERAAPRNEELTEDSVVTFRMSAGEIAEIGVTPRSAISGQYHPRVKKDIGDISDNTGIFAQYANAKEANVALANEKLTFTTNEYFANNVDGKPKILATTFELPYPELPYNEGKAAAYLRGSAIDGSVSLDTNDASEQNALSVGEKTYRYKFVTVNGETYEGTKKITSRKVGIKDCEPSLDWYQVARATYSVEPFHIVTFFTSAEVAPDAVTVENLIDHL